MAGEEHCEGMNMVRLRVVIRGAVQGVGFRPFIYRLAEELRLSGWVSNSPQGVLIEAEGDKSTLIAFLLRIEKEKPSRSAIQSLEYTFLDREGFDRFEIRESDLSGEVDALILPDLSTCPECAAEIADPCNRRYRYPFTNCTNCGPRYSIIESLPYDRPNTSMKDFSMCPECRAEYDKPNDRRFHAQPIACHACGPHLELWDAAGNVLSTREAALLASVEAIRSGKIVAVKGLGGFHLMADARNERTVRSLRTRKHREEKPFAVMFPSLADVKGECTVSELEERLLMSPENPIVILARHPSSEAGRSVVTPSVAPGNPYFGAILPYTPLHHLLLGELGFPVVATSGNISDEPICIDERQVLEKLNGIADVFLVHDRPIVQRVDDSIVRVALGREFVVRRARGYAPLPVMTKESADGSILAVGANLKNSVALAKNSNVFVSQYIGDLDTTDAQDNFRTVIKDLTRLYNAEPTAAVCDLHPDYFSTQYAMTSGLHVVQVQHHYAHVASCMAENQLEGTVLGVSWDGTGFGLDGTIWGGEFLLTNERSFERVAHFRRFMLPGGESAIREPRRAAVGLLYEIFGDSLFDRNDLLPLKSFTSTELILLRRMLSEHVNAHATSSVGRLFDAVSSILGIRNIAKYEGQAAMELEWMIGASKRDEKYPYTITECRPTNGETASPENIPAQQGQGPKWEIDWAPTIRELIDDMKRSVKVSMMAARFHNTLSSVVVKIAKKVGVKRIVLSGGCFQNMYLLERTVHLLEEQGFRPYWNQRIPCNDGGIAVGQIYAAERLRDEGVVNDVGSMVTESIT